MVIQFLVHAAVAVQVAGTKTETVLELVSVQAMVLVAVQAVVSVPIINEL